MTSNELKKVLKYIFIDNGEEALKRQYMSEVKKHEAVYCEGVVRGKVDNVIIHYNMGEAVDEIAWHTGISRSTVRRLIKKLNIDRCDEKMLYSIFTDEDKMMIDYNVKMLYEDNNQTYIEWLADKIIQHFSDNDAGD